MTWFYLPFKTATQAIKSPACTIGVLAEAVKSLFNPDAEIKEIGIRHGEKMFETLMTSEEKVKSEDIGNYFRIPVDARNLNYEKYLSRGDKVEPYTSSNTEILDVEGTKKKLLTVDYVQKRLGGKI